MSYPPPSGPFPAIARPQKPHLCRRSSSLVIGGLGSILNRCGTIPFKKDDSFASSRQFPVRLVFLVHQSLPKRHTSLGISQICPANFSAGQRGPVVGGFLTFGMPFLPASTKRGIAWLPHHRSCKTG